MIASLPTRHARLPLVALLAASAVSQVGSALTFVAVPWFVLHTTGSAAQAGLTGVAEALPFVIGGIFGGTLVDRLGFRRVSIIGDAASGVTVALIPLLYGTVGLALWQLLALVFLGGLLNAPGGTARRSLLPDLATRAGTTQERANAAAQAIPRLATLLGPPTAGVLIAVLGTTTVLYVDAATFAFSALAIAVAVPSAHDATRATETGGARDRYWDELSEGFRFIRRDALLFPLMLTFAVTNFLDAPFSLLLAVRVAGTTGKAEDLGFLIAAFGAGALIASLLFGVIGHHLPRRVPLLLWMGGFAVANSVFALTPPRPVLLVVLFGMGLAAGLVNPMTGTVMNERIPAALRGRVFGLTTAIGFAAIPLGRGVAGLLAETVGVRLVYAGIAAAYTVILCVTLVIPAYRLLNQSHPTPATTTDPIV